MRPLHNPTRILFFTGKGGVGKTSFACATALSLADAGRRVLLVSTDPASNLDEVLGVSLSDTPRPVPGASGLHALNIDPEAAARAYRDRIIGPYRTLLPAAAVRSMEEQLSGACTVEIAAFDAFTALLGEPSTTAAFDHVIFDTAPTGHTLRLLELPAAWTTFLDTNVGGTSCLGPLAGLEKQRGLYAASQAALRDPATTTLVLVARPEIAALREAERTRDELAQLGLRRVVLVLNGLFRVTDADDPVASALATRGEAALRYMLESTTLGALPRIEVPLSPHALLGLDALRAMARGALPAGRTPPPVTAGTPPALESTEGLNAIIDRISARGRGVVMTMGKGGVGKTTIATRIALGLARRGHAVTLTTTDPAAHVAETARAFLDAHDDAPGDFEVTRIDPAVETARYTALVLETAGAGLDAHGRALLEEDLRSPCTEEIAVFRAFAETVSRGTSRFVVIDTAPTGHTLLLLDAAEAYHRDVLRKPSGSPEAVLNLLPRLRDPAYTHVLIVTLPEATPVHEAMHLEADLGRAGITPFAWVVNQSLAPVAVRDPVLLARRAAETRSIDEVVAHAPTVVIEPWRAEAAGGVS